MQQLLYAAEVRSIKDIEIPKTEVRDAELKLAQQLIEQQAAETLRPGRLHRRGARRASRRRSRRRSQGQEITLAEAPEPAARR